MRAILCVLALLVITLAALVHHALKVAGAAVLILALAWLWRRVSVRIWGYRKCFWCRGTGKNLGSTSSRWGSCWFGCDSGKRYRRGARRA